jgi:hypothetical protein
VLAQDLGGFVAVGYEVGAVGAECEFNYVFDCRGLREEGFNIGGEVVPG